MPDLFRERFGSPALGIASSLLVITFMTFMMVAQFKAGALVIKVAWPNWAMADAKESNAQELKNQESTAANENPAGADQQHVATAATGKNVPAAPSATPDSIYYFALVFFTITVVGYTLVGGFLAAVWTDLFQSVMMLIGVVILFCLALPAAGGLEQASREAIAHTGPGFAFAPGYSQDARAFLPLGLAFSYFVIWPATSFSTPASPVRLMACRDTLTIRRSIVVLGIYNFLIYLPLVAICICARAILPDVKASDEIIPRMALLTTSDLWGGSWIAGLILAAPFGAIMATVSSYLVVIASGLVRDIYQRFFRPHATQREIRLLTYALMVVVGAVAVISNIKPVTYLQAIVVFSGTGAAASFLVPLIMTCYWRRATTVGTLASMLSGAATMFCLFAIGWMNPQYDPKIWVKTSFRPYFLLGVEPIVWGLLISLMVGVIVSLLSKAPPRAKLENLFGSAKAGD